MEQNTGLSLSARLRGAAGAGRGRAGRSQGVVLKSRLTSRFAICAHEADSLRLKAV